MIRDKLTGALIGALDLDYGEAADIVDGYFDHVIKYVIEYAEGLESDAEKHGRAIEATREVNRRLIAEKLELLARVSELGKGKASMDVILEGQVGVILEMCGDAKEREAKIEGLESDNDNKRKLLDLQDVQMKECKADNEDLLARVAELEEQEKTFYELVQEKTCKILELERREATSNSVLSTQGETIELQGATINNLIDKGVELERELKEVKENHSQMCRDHNSRNF